MGSRGVNECDVWLWDGASEFEGILLKLQDASFTARVRRAGKAETTLGKRLPSTTIDLQRLFTKRRFLAHVKGAVEGTLFEASIESVQISSKTEFEYLLAGRFGQLDEKQLDMLRRMSVENAATLLQRQAC